MKERCICEVVSHHYWRIEDALSSERQAGRRILCQSAEIARSCTASAVRYSFLEKDSRVKYSNQPGYASHASNPPMSHARARITETKARASSNLSDDWDIIWCCGSVAWILHGFIQQHARPHVAISAHTHTHSFLMVAHAHPLHILFSPKPTEKFRDAPCAVLTQMFQRKQSVSVN